MIKKLVAILMVTSFAAVTPSFATSATFMEGQFEEVMDIGVVTSIEGWEQPKTPYTPGNLESEYQVRVSGTDKNGRGAYSYTMHFTDYDTKIKGNGITQDGRYYVTDTSGRSFVTGEHVDLEPINQSINEIDGRVTNNTNNINSINNRVDGINNQVNGLTDRVNNIDNRLDTMNNRMKQGFATVTALTSLHPNPRSNEKLEVSIGTGMYMDTFAGAIGLFYHPNDRVQIYAGGAYGGHDSWAGGAGITFSLGRKHK